MDLQTVGAFFLGAVLLMAAGVLVGFMLENPGKRELEDELEELRRVRESNEAALGKVIEEQKARCAELENAVAFYKADAGYYKEQAEKNLELLREAVKNGRD